MKNMAPNEKVLGLTIFGLIYLVFLFLYYFYYSVIELSMPGLNTLLGVVANLLTLSVILFVVPFGLVYSCYMLLFKKQANKTNSIILFISLISIMIMVVGTIYE